VFGQSTCFDCPDDLEAPNSRPSLAALHLNRTLCGFIKVEPATHALLEPCRAKVRHEIYVKVGPRLSVNRRINNHRWLASLESFGRNPRINHLILIISVLL
jgi:hypothetical protein